eukprot:6070-Amphidinium_carterae.1
MDAPAAFGDKYADHEHLLWHCLPKQGCHKSPPAPNAFVTNLPVWDQESMICSWDGKDYNLNSKK